jgi:hypothetical protein
MESAQLTSYNLYWTQFINAINLKCDNASLMFHINKLQETVNHRPWKLAKQPQGSSSSSVGPQANTEIADENADAVYSGSFLTASPDKESADRRFNLDVPPAAPSA